MSTTMTTVTRITIVLFSCLMLGEAYNFAQSSSIVNINGKVFRKTVTDYGNGNRRAGVSIIATKDKGNDVRATITSSDSKTSNVDKQVKTDPTGWTGSGRRVPTTNTGTRKTPKTSAQSCKDTNAMCSSWSASGECARNPRYMKAYCKKSCGICGGRMGKKEEPRLPLFVSTSGECTRNPSYMKAYCIKSCIVCGSSICRKDESCTDDHSKCSHWSNIGECQRNPSYMVSTCKKSCGVCGKAKVNTNGCVDKNNQCGFWTKRGECGKNPTYMHKMCARSCNKC